MFSLRWQAGRLVTPVVCSLLPCGRPAAKKCVLALGLKTTPAVMGNSCSAFTGNRLLSGGKSSSPDKMSSGEYFEKVVCDEDDIAEGECKEYELGENLSCILLKQRGQISALSNKCTHFGAPLVKGSVGDGIIRCPWHGACFNATTGDIEDFPGLDSLTKYEVNVQDGQVQVRAPKSAAGRYRRKEPCKLQDPTKCVVIVGGGAAGQVCAETLRTRDHQPWTGRILMLTKDRSHPYDRTKISKAMDMTAEKLRLRDEEFYTSANIEVMTNTEVVKVDTESKRVETKNGDSFPFNYLVLATGGRPRTLEIPGSDLKNVFYLRSPGDGNSIASASRGKKVVVVGSSFIGMEVASFLADKASSVTVVGNSAVPFSAVLGQEVGTYLMGVHESKGVKFVMGSTPVGFSDDGRSGELSKVTLANGAELDADVCVLGIGVVPSTEFLKGSGVQLDGRGFVPVKPDMTTNLDDVYAIGDISSFPLGLPTIKTEAAIGHWQLASAHGKNAGLNVGASMCFPLKTVPFFWTVQFGKSIRYAGFVGIDSFDKIIYDGDVVEGKVVAYYAKKGIVMAVATLMRDPVAADFANLLSEGRLLPADQALSGKWRKL